MNLFPQIDGKLYMKTFKNKNIGQLYLEKLLEMKSTAGHLPGYFLYGKIMVNIIPNKNLVENIGFGPNATNTKL